MKTILFPLILVTLILSGCVKGLDRTAGLPSYMASEEYQNRPKATESLFGTDEAVLRGANIEQILTSKVVIPQKARLAIMPFGHRREWRWWSEEFSKLDQNLETGMIAKLQSCKHVADVSLLPSMMVPDKQSIPYLREAAARYQADLLLVYRTGSRTFDKVRFLSPNEVKAKCVVEAILLDTRTGIVPFSSVSAQEYTAKKEKDDYEFSETIARAELSAIKMGLEKIGDDLDKFLGVLP